MKRTTAFAIAAGLALWLGQAPLHAQPPAHAGKPAGTPQGGPSMGMADPPERHREAERHHNAPSYRFSDRDRGYIEDWYSRNLPPGLAKQGKIPPGHAKRLARGQSWPPSGVAYEPLPRELIRQLGPLPDHLRYYRVGTDVVIADMAGNVVRDVIYDVLNR